MSLRSLKSTKSQLEDFEVSQAEESLAEVMVDDEGVEKTAKVEEAVVEEVEIKEDNCD
jgi:hypothetical protein